jgi:hypothetical protein
LPIQRLAFRKEKGKVVMTPQKSQPKVVRPNGKGKPAPASANGKTPPVDWAAFLTGISRGKTVLEYGANRTVFAQGDPADSVWYLKHGKVKLAVTSQQGKEAIVSILSDNEFFGEGCLAGQLLRISTASAVTDCTLFRIEMALMVRLLHEQQGIADCSLRTCFHATFDLKGIWSTSFSTPVRSAWPGFSYCWRILASRVGPKLSIPESIRNTWPKWSASPGLGSAIP